MSQCRICDSLNVRSVIDLGDLPLANRLKPATDTPEKRFPLEVEFCRDCGNIQLTHCVAASELFDDYLYVTPTSPTLEAHHVNLIYHLRAHGYLPKDAFVLEFGSNVGHFLHYAQTQGSRVLGIDLARAIVEMANARGVPTRCGPTTSRTRRRPSARTAGPRWWSDGTAPRTTPIRTPSIDGARRPLARGGVFVIETASGLDTVLHGEIGEIYHEHMYYYTARSVARLFAENGLELVDLMPTEIHGGSMVFLGAVPGSWPGARSSRRRSPASERYSTMRS